MQRMPAAFALALAKAGSSIPAKMAMMAITTSNSMSVNAFRNLRLARPVPPHFEFKVVIQHAPQRFSGDSISW